MARSDRYPLSVQLEIEEDVFPAWNALNATPGAIVGGLIGALVSALGLSAINRRYGALLALRKAMRSGEIQPFFQPVFALGSREVIGCEVLVRWIRNGRVKQAPDKFIPRAEEDGSIIELTEYLLDEALEKLGPVLAAKPDFGVAFNIAPHHFQEPGFVDWLSSRIASLGLSPAQIVLEITERQSFTDARKAKEAVGRAQRSGFKIALDDTGMGHNGLANVQELGSDIIKIDKKFVDLVGVDEAATAIVVMLVGLAGRLGATTVAEGIESEVQLAELLRCGVKEGQGYLIAPPLPIHKFQRFLSGERG
jgi:sensor c-di-GMP phosphodiesterase-like protein